MVKQNIRNARTKRVKKYLEKVDAEIERIVDQEYQYGLTTTGEADLHLLLANRKDVMKWQRERA